MVDRIDYYLNKLFEDCIFLPLSLAISLCALFLGGYNLSSDVYTSFPMIRPFGYPVILESVKVVVGDNFIFVVCLAQYMGWLYVSKLLIERLKAALKVDSGWCNFAMVFLLLPWMFNYCGLIMVEPFTYICWGLFISELFLFWNDLNMKRLAVCSLCLFIALSFRSQMMLMGVLMLATSVGVFLRSEKRKALLIVAFVCSVVVLYGLCERTYRYILYDEFRSPPLAGINMMCSPIYLFEESYAKDVEDKDTREDLLWINNELKRIGFHRNQAMDSGLINLRIHTFPWAYAKVISVTAARAQHYGLRKPIEVDGFYARLGKAAMYSVAVNDPVKFVGHYLQNIVFLGFGSYYETVFVLLICSVAFIFWVKSLNTVSYVVFLSSLACIGNYVGVSLVQVVNFRYAFYSKTLLFVVLFVLLIKHICKWNLKAQC